jgi:hypothetical protein
VVRSGYFEKFLKMVLQLPCLALEVAFGGRNMFLAGGASFLIIAVITGRDSNAPRASLLPLLATLGAFPSTFDGGFGKLCSAAASGRLRVA